MTVIQEQATVDQLKAEGHKVTTASNWTFGEISSRLVAEHGWTDQQVADEFGKSQQSVNYARRIFEKFYQRAGKHSFVWRDWMKIVAWPDADKCLDWAEEMEATFSELAAWRRMQNGEDIKQPATPTPAANLTSEDLPATETKTERQEPVARPQSTTKHTAATRKTTEVEKPRTQPVQQVETSVDPISNLQDALADIQKTLPDGPQRKKIAKELRKTADKLDPQKYPIPTIEDVEAFVSERGWNGFDAEKFWNHYELADWKYGKAKTPLKKWKIAAGQAWNNGAGWCASGSDQGASPW